MSEIITSARQINLFYSSDSVRAKKVLALARAKGIPIWEIDILSTPLTGTQVLELAARLNLRVEEMVNQDHPCFTEHFGHLELSEIDWLKVIEHYPEVLKQPIAMRSDKTVLIETPTDVLRLFE